MYNVVKKQTHVVPFDCIIVVVMVNHKNIFTSTINNIKCFLYKSDRIQIKSREKGNQRTLLNTKVSLCFLVNTGGLTENYKFSWIFDVDLVIISNLHL